MVKVSIIIPYNQDRGYLKQAIASCEDQDGFILGVDYEIIPWQGDCGVSKNINDAVKTARGEFSKICAEEDILTPNCLQSLYEKAIEGYDVVCANAIKINNDHGDWDSLIPETVHDLAVNNTINGGTTLYRKSVMPLWDESLWTAEEYDISLRMAVAGCRFGYVDEVVFCYRIWRGQKSRVGRHKTGDDVIRSAFIQALRMRYMDNYNKIVR